MCGPEYSYLKEEIEKLREENKMLRSARNEAWDKASHAIRTEHMLNELMQHVMTVREVRDSA